MVLPPLTKQAALRFVRDVLERHRLGSVSSPYFPFSKATCKAIIDWLSQNSELKPRTIMQVFGQILGEADSHFRTDPSASITREFALQALAEYTTFGHSGAER